MSGRGVKGSSMEHQNARGRSRGRGSQRARGRGRCASFNEGQTPGRTAQKTQSQSAGSATTGADRRTEERAGLAARRDHPLEGEHKVEKKEEKPQKLIRDDDPVLPSVKPKENHLSQPILTGEARLEETNCIPRKHQLSNPVQELENLSIKGKGSTSSSAKPAGQIQGNLAMVLCEIFYVCMNASQPQNLVTFAKILQRTRFNDSKGKNEKFRTKSHDMICILSNVLLLINHFIFSLLRP